MIKEDLRRYGIRWYNLPKAWLQGGSVIAVIRYRIASWLVQHKFRFLPHIISFGTMKKYGCEISPYAKIQGGVFLPHTLGIVIGYQVVIGKNCEIFQHVTIGMNRKENNGRFMPIIGDNVSIGTGATIVGPIHIGNNVVIGANAYVDKDIPDNVKVIGRNIFKLSEQSR